MPQFQPELVPNSSPVASPVEPGSDALAHLAKMSGTGSSFGQADYVAINAAAIASLVLGVVGILSLVFSFFLVAAAAAVFTGLLAIRQIRHSNGTQSGLVLALGGVLMSLLIGGGKVVSQLMDLSRQREETRQCADLLSRFGQALKDRQYDTAYDSLTTEAFRERVTRSTFRGTFEQLQSASGYGPMESIMLKDQPVDFQTLPDSSDVTASTMAMVKFGKFKEAGREYFQMTNKEGSWKIENIPGIFREKKKRSPMDQ